MIDNAAIRRAGERLKANYTGRVRFYLEAGPGPQWTIQTTLGTIPTNVRKMLKAMPDAKVYRIACYSDKARASNRHDITAYAREQPAPYVPARTWVNHVGGAE